MPDLAPSDVAAVYREVLGREASEPEIARQCATLGSLGELLRMVLHSDEYAAAGGPSTVPAQTKARRPAPRVNIHHPDLAEWAHTPGTRSEDGVAVVGHEGWLFLSGGTNLNLPQFLGAVRMEDEWLDSWRAAVTRRRADVDALGASMAMLIVPDKLAVYEEHFPEPLVREGPRPVELLLAADLPLVYPLAALREAAVREPVYLRTDTHLSFAGNQVLYDAIRDNLAPAGEERFPRTATSSYLTSGDLGERFGPQIVEVVPMLGTMGNARFVADNRDALTGVGAHVGMRRVLVNDAAPDPRTAVVYGDSFANPSPHYHGLAWFLAQAFRETHFLWTPFGWDPGYAARAGAGVVVFEAAERFVGRAPASAVDFNRLTSDALAVRPTRKP